MKTLVCTQPGEFQYQQGEAPVLQEGQAIIKIRRIGICGTDLHIYNWDAWAHSRIHPPRTIGHEMCGEVVAIFKYWGFGWGGDWSFTDPMHVELARIVNPG